MCHVQTTIKLQLNQFNALREKKIAVYDEHTQLYSHRHRFDSVRCLFYTFSQTPSILVSLLVLSREWKKKVVYEPKYLRTKMLYTKHKLTKITFMCVCVCVRSTERMTTNADDLLKSHRAKATDRFAFTQFGLAYLHDFHSNKHNKPYVYSIHTDSDAKKKTKQNHHTINNFAVAVVSSSILLLSLFFIFLLHVRVQN